MRSLNTYIHTCVNRKSTQERWENWYQIICICHCKHIFGATGNVYWRACLYISHVGPTSESIPVSRENVEVTQTFIHSTAWFTRLLAVDQKSIDDWDGPGSRLNSLDGVGHVCKRTNIRVSCAGPSGLAIILQNMHVDRHTKRKLFRYAQWPGV